MSGSQCSRDQGCNEQLRHAATLCSARRHGLAVSPSKTLAYKDAGVILQPGICAWILQRLTGRKRSSSAMTGLHTHLDRFYELLDDEAAACADPFLSAMRALSVHTCEPPLSHHCVHCLACVQIHTLQQLPLMLCRLQFADELGLGAFIAREVRVSAPEWERLHAEVKQPFCPAAWWRHQLSWPCRLLGCARETTDEDQPTGSRGCQPGRPKRP